MLLDVAIYTGIINLKACLKTVNMKYQANPRVMILSETGTTDTRLV